MSSDIESLAPGEAVAVDWTVDQYLADNSALTRSAIGNLPDRPHELENWIAGKSNTRDTDAFRFGRLLHLALLEFDEFRRRVLVEAVRPEIADGRAPAGTPERVAYETWRVAHAARREVLARNAEAIPASANDMAALTGIVDAAGRNPEARSLLAAPGQCEQTIIWREPVTEALVKVRVDKLLRLRAVDTFGTKLVPGLAVMELKSADNDAPRQFARSILRYGYLPQAAMYTDAVAALHDETPQWLFVAASKTPVDGDRHGVSVYSLTDDQIARGRDIYRSQLAEAVERTATDNWTAAHRRGVNALPL